MEIKVLKPSGYCNGVKHAFDIIQKARIENPNQKIYIFGPLIHNKIALNDLEDNNFIILQKDIEVLKFIEDESIIVFPAHGHTKEMKEIALNKKLKIYDAICPFIKENIDVIKESLKRDETIYFYGLKSHDETKAILSISNDIYLIDKILLKNNYFLTNKKSVFISQSTMKESDLNEFKNAISNKIPNIDTTFARVCNTTHIRQKAILDVDANTDLILVIGDSTSNNTKELYSVAKSHHPHIETFLIESKDDLDLSIISNKKHIVISSGASTPDKVIDDVVSYLKQII